LSHIAGQTAQCTCTKAQVVYNTLSKPLDNLLNLLYS